MDFTFIKSNLEKLGYQVSCFDTSAEACAYLGNAIHGKTVGFGGSVTLRELGLYEKLKTNNRVFWHWQPENDMSAEATLKLAHTADVYISSVNGIAESGEIVNIDGNCNRIAGMLYGHEKVYFVIGENKIEPSEEKAIFRARNIAAPLNAKRLNRKTPCAVSADRCYNCKTPDKICRALSVLLEKPSGMDYEVILIHEALGY